MRDPLTRLTNRTALLGNYNRKYIHIISKNIDKLTSALDRHRLRDQVHLWSYSTEIPGEMDTVLSCASDTNDKLDLLGCYFALQFLQMNLRMVDIVKIELANSSERWRTGKRLMLEIGRTFRFLTKNYMQRLLDIFLSGENNVEYAVLGVGTRADQDDIDMGVIHDGSDDVHKLNLAFGQLSSEMLKKATRLHFHLSEHVGQNSLVASIDEYEDILKKGMYDFVIVTEMLGANLIMGDNSLFQQFKSRVTNRFYYRSSEKQNRYHEGYLRGILGEIQSLLNRPKSESTIAPKDDILRPIKTLLSALKLVYGVDKVNAWQIVEELKTENEERLSEYQTIEQALSFFELFRFLYQITVSQDEDIPLNEPGIAEMVARISEMFGFEQVGVVSAKDFMLVNYYEFLQSSNRAIDVLTSDLRSHLRKISIFRPIFLNEGIEYEEARGNIAVDFIRTSSFFKGITYWDDFLEVLNDDESDFYDNFIKGFTELTGTMKNIIGSGYVYGVVNDPTYALRLLVILGKRAQTQEGKDVFKYISDLFVDRLSELSIASNFFTRMVYSHPELLHSFYTLINWELLEKIADLVQEKPGPPELIGYHDQLLALVNIHYKSSQFFKRHFHPILKKHPIFIKNLPNRKKLKHFTDAFYSDLTTHLAVEKRIEHLGDFYDLEFVRVSLLAMDGVPCKVTDAEFIDFCDKYTVSLYEFCQQKVHLSLGYSLHSHGLFALYATGGHAREHGFDDDYDMIAILDSPDEAQIEYYNMIIAEMNTEILKRGILPHHRFADYFDSYIIPLEKLADYLCVDSDDRFIDKAQILCSRIMVGTPIIENKLQDEIITPLIFARHREFIEQLVSEMRSRHYEEDEVQRHDIKECSGGLRDIEMLLMMYKAKYKVRDPLSRKFLQRLGETEPENKKQFNYIEEHLNFLKNLRDLYRLKTAAHDVIDPHYLLSIAESMKYGNDHDSALKLYQEFLSRTDEASGVIGAMVDKINQ
ncbi:MAG: hypothetical protein GF315_02700 [candidate division Zixibacteria bacterium]|nr:hypothetical protein [candidate division Zixibacteria bacterium]